MPTCEECGKDFDTEKGLKIHMSKVHEEEDEESFDKLESMKEKIGKLREKVGKEGGEDDSEDLEEMVRKKEEMMKESKKRDIESEEKVEENLKKEVEKTIEKEKSVENSVEGGKDMSEEKPNIGGIDKEKLEKMKSKISDSKLEDKSDDELAGIQLGIEETKEKFEKLQEELDKVVIGLDKVKKNIAISLLVDGNLLLEGVPGLAKSLLVETLSNIITGCDFNRIQFVPDMLPADILGNRVYNQKKGEFYINKGPVFSNFILADEINRAPPKTQAAMMEVMQEKKVSIEKKEFKLEPPFLVLATQNPLEQKGTYPLPEAIIDRFFMKLDLGYPLKSEEMEILEANTIRTAIPFQDLNEILDKEDILEAQEVVRNIYISKSVKKYIVDIVIEARGTNNPTTESMKYVDYGPGPRATIWLAMGASAEAVLNGRAYVIPEDVKNVAKGILRHRILLNYEGKIADITTDDIIEDILQEVGTV